MKTKKVLAVVLALVMALALSVTAFAAAGENNGKKPEDAPTKIDVTGAYSGEGTPADVYSVDISWGSMEFTYKTTGDKTWNPETHEYNVTEGDGWVVEDGADVVTVVNHSNAAVQVAFSFEKDNEPYKGPYTGSMTNESETLDPAVENTDPDTAPSTTSKLQLTGKLNAVQTESTKLGQITVSLSAVTVQP